LPSELRVDDLNGAFDAILFSDLLPERARSRTNAFIGYRSPDCFSQACG
jgi:hypothetical protein